MNVLAVFQFAPKATARRTIVKSEIPDAPPADSGRGRGRGRGGEAGRGRGRDDFKIMQGEVCRKSMHLFMFSNHEIKTGCLVVAQVAFVGGSGDVSSTVTELIVCLPSFIMAYFFCVQPRMVRSNRGPSEALLRSRMAVKSEPGDVSVCHAPRQ